MSDSLDLRQHDVNQPVRPARLPAGDAFTELVFQVAWLGGMFTAKGEALSRLAGQTLARWLILDAVEDGPSTVAQIARGRGIARQAVQRVADLLEREGLVEYAPNPGHRRAKLLHPTPAGREILRTISNAQKAWADRLGTEIGEEKLRQAAALIEEVRRVASRATAPQNPAPVWE
jgi:DNA-binding MarR family transcriptional regulator